MIIPTCDVQCSVFEDDGLPVQGATISAKLSTFEIYNGYVVPKLVEATTNAAGNATLALWPNQLGAVESVYHVMITTPSGKRLKTTATVPNVSTAYLHQIAELPPYDGKSDGQLALDAAVASAATVIAKAAEAASSASSADTSAISASTSATSASSSATSASASATTATTKASDAATSATAAASSATSAVSAKTAAESARDQALAAFDSFDDRYLGAKSSDPNLDNDANALQEGALYWNTTSKEMRAYSGSAWSAAYLPSGAYAQLSGATFTGPVGLSDQEITRAIIKDQAYAYYNSGTANALDYTNGSHQRWAPAGTVTLSFTNWPPSGNLGELLIEGINLGGATITWPTINWVKIDGTNTTSISTYLSSIGRALQSGGTDFFLLWTRDSGTTVYGKLV